MTIPDDVMQAAITCWEEASGFPATAASPVYVIARAIMADRESRWQPIETAPKDGTEIILYCPQGDGTPGKTFRVSAGSWFVPDEYEILRRMDIGEASGDEEPMWLSWDGGFSEDTMMPTHWMPLPQPPSGGQNEGD